MIKLDTKKKCPRKIIPDYFSMQKKPQKTHLSSLDL